MIAKILSLICAVQLAFSGWGSNIGSIRPAPATDPSSYVNRSETDPVYMIWGLEKDMTREEIGEVIRRETGVMPEAEDTSWKIKNRKGFTYYGMPAYLYACCFEDARGTYLYNLTINLDVTGKGTSWAAWEYPFKRDEDRAAAAQEIVQAYAGLYERFVQDVGEATYAGLSLRREGQQLYEDCPNTPYEQGIVDLEALTEQLASPENRAVQFRIQYDNVELLLFTHVEGRGKQYLETTMKITYINRAEF